MWVCGGWPVGVLPYGDEVVGDAEFVGYGPWVGAVLKCFIEEKTTGSLERCTTRTDELRMLINISTIG